MRLLDLNLLLYALDETSPRHDAAAPWLEAQLNGSETVGLPWVVLLGFVRLSTRSAVFADPFTAEQSLDVVDGWLRLPVVTTPQETPDHARVLRELLAPTGTAGNLTSDAHLAALAVEHGAELCSTDSDFARFPGLRWTDPLR
ncbi:TA system VapC family ribonuclease toxin [Pseudokineococcus basanitobsidens]|uniref:Ribonuclease VapC n=1 Tax=Pseudokineococcus basanitobsidens TaxID=1926649 RepID=A0ABU8RGK7_9ACTN